VPGSNGRRELRFLVGNEPEKFTLHAIVDFPGESSLYFPETEGPRNGPARSPPVRSPVDTVQAGIRCGRADPQLLHLLSSEIPPAFPELPTVDLGHRFPTLPLIKMEHPLNTAHCTNAISYTYVLFYRFTPSACKRPRILFFSVAERPVFCAGFAVRAIFQRNLPCRVGLVSGDRLAF